MRSKRTLKTMTLPIAILLLVFSACVDEYNRFTPYENNRQIDNFFRTVQTLENTVTIDNQKENIIYTDNLVVIRIPENAFADADGNIVEGQVEFTYLDIVDQGIIMLYHVPTISSGDLIESAGVFKLNAQKNGQTLQLDKRINIQLPNENPVNDMQLFYGDRVGLDEFNWDVLPETEIGWEQIILSEWNLPDSLGSFGFGYEFLVDELTWINCDRFIDLSEDEKTSVCVSLPEEYTNTNTIAFVVFNDINSVLGLYGDPQKMLFCEPNNACPIGYGVTFVAISERSDGTYRFGIKETVLENNHEESIEPEEKTLQEILDILGMF